MAGGKTLTIETIMNRTKCDKLTAIKNLNLWGNDLEDITCISQVPNLEVISFTVNKIKSLKSFGNLTYLRELYMRNNKISNFDEIKHLKSCLSLKTLSLNENPISEMPNYREMVINYLPQLIKLDDKIISNEEKSSFHKGKELNNEKDEKSKKGRYENEGFNQQVVSLNEKRNSEKTISKVVVSDVNNFNDENDELEYVEKRKSNKNYKTNTNTSNLNKNRINEMTYDLNSSANQVETKKNKSNLNNDNKQKQIQYEKDYYYNNDYEINQEEDLSNTRHVDEERISENSKNILKSIDYLLDNLGLYELKLLRNHIDNKIESMLDK